LIKSELNAVEVLYLRNLIILEPDFLSAHVQASLRRKLLRMAVSIAMKEHK
jgi:hypothetical protein